MSYNYALFIKHLDPEYITEHDDPTRPGGVAYDTVYPDLISVMKVELAKRVAAGDTDGSMSLTRDLDNKVTIERSWATEASARAWADYSLAVHPEYGAPTPLEIRLKNLETSVETVIHPV